MNKKIVMCAAVSAALTGSLAFGFGKGGNNQRGQKPAQAPKEFKAPEETTVTGTVTSVKKGEHTFYTLTTEDGKTYVLETPDMKKDMPGRNGKNDGRPEAKRKPGDDRKGQKPGNAKGPAPKGKKGAEANADSERPEPPKDAPNVPELHEFVKAEDVAALEGKTATVKGFILSMNDRPEVPNGAEKDGKKGPKPPKGKGNAAPESNAEKPAEPLVKDGIFAVISIE